MYFKWLSHKVHILIDIEYYGETQDLGILKPLRSDEFYSNKKLGVKMSRNIPF